MFRDLKAETELINQRLQDLDNKVRLCTVCIP